MSTPVQQTLRRAAYEGLEFPLVELKDELGHDSVQHQAYRQPASIEWTGRKILRTTLRAALLTGLSSWPADAFPRLHDQLEALLRSKPQGRLRHRTTAKCSCRWTRGRAVSTRSYRAAATSKSCSANAMRAPLLPSLSNKAQVIPQRRWKTHRAQQTQRSQR